MGDSSRDMNLNDHRIRRFFFLNFFSLEASVDKSQNNSETVPEHPRKEERERRKGAQGLICWFIRICDRKVRTNRKMNTKKAVW